MRAAARYSVEWAPRRHRIARLSHFAQTMLGVIAGIVGSTIVLIWLADWYSGQ